MLAFSSRQGKIGEIIRDKDSFGEGELNSEFKVVMEWKENQVNIEYKFPRISDRKLRGLSKTAPLEGST